MKINEEYSCVGCDYENKGYTPRCQICLDDHSTSEYKGYIRTSVDQMPIEKDEFEYISAETVLLHCEEMKKWPVRYLSKDVQVAIRALEKQISKPVCCEILIETDETLETCPGCGCFVHGQYCHMCGQKLSWKEN